MTDGEEDAECVSQKMVKENFDGQDYSFMSDQQLMEMCGRLSSCQSWMLALHSQLINEKAKLSKHGHALREQIRLVENHFEVSPVPLQPSVEIADQAKQLELSMPEDVLASVDSNGDIQLTWFYDESLLECLVDPQHSLKTLEFQVKQQTEGLNGHIRTRFHTIPCSGAIEEQRFAPPGCIACRTYSFSIRARAKYEDEANERVSHFCEPVEASPTGKQLTGVGSLDTRASQPIHRRSEAAPPSKSAASVEHVKVEGGSESTHSQKLACVEIATESKASKANDSDVSIKVLEEAEVNQRQVSEGASILASSVEKKYDARLPEMHKAFIDSSEKPIQESSKTIPSAEDTQAGLDKLQQEQAELRKAMLQLQEEKAGFAADLEARMRAMQACQVGTEMWKRLGENRSAGLESCASSGVWDSALVTTAASTAASASEAAEEVDDRSKEESPLNADNLTRIADVNRTFKVTRGVGAKITAEVQPAPANSTVSTSTPAKTSNITVLCQDFLNDTPGAASRTVQESPCSVASRGTRLVCMGSRDPSPARVPNEDSSEKPTLSPPTIRLPDNAQMVRQDEITDCKVDLAKVKLHSANDSFSENREASSGTDDPTKETGDETETNKVSHIRLASYWQAVAERNGSENIQPMSGGGAKNGANVLTAKTVSPKIQELLQEKLQLLSEEGHSDVSNLETSRTGVGGPLIVQARAKSAPRAQKHLQDALQGPHLQQQQQQHLSKTQVVTPPAAVSSQVLQPSQQREMIATSRSLSAHGIHSRRQVQPQPHVYQLMESQNVQNPLQTMLSRSMSPHRIASSRQYHAHPNFVSHAEAPLSRSCLETSGPSHTPQVSRVQLQSIDIHAPPGSPHPLLKRRTPGCQRRSFRTEAEGAMPGISPTIVTVPVPNQPVDAKDRIDTSTIPHAIGVTAAMSGSYSSVDNSANAFAPSTVRSATTSELAQTFVSKNVVSSVIPQTRSNSRSHPCFAGDQHSHHHDSARNVHVKIVGNPNIETFQSRSNSRSQPCVAGEPVPSYQWVANPQIEAPHSRSNSRSRRTSYHQPSLVQVPLIAPGSALQTNATLAAGMPSPHPRSSSRDSVRPIAFNQNNGVQTITPNMNSPLSGISPPLNSPPAGRGQQGQRSEMGLAPVFPGVPGFQVAQPFQFFSSSQGLPQAGDLQPDGKDLPPPPRSAPAAFQHQNQVEFHCADPAAPLRVAPASLQTFPSSVEVPPPPRCAPAAGACGPYQGLTGSSKSSRAIRPHMPRDGHPASQFTLNIQSSDDRWETCIFSDSASLDDQAVAFLRQHNLKWAFQAGLVAKMQQMVSSAQRQASVDIVDLI
mmetsp:Transcript_27426/g.44002  ORF Transcript_27426/g.44002 Transcript_27426/m.44002 type:complete len:1324 (+) Transcript_27426:130-4101(+)